MQLIELGFHNTAVFKIHAILAQKYAGDITIVPRIPWRKYLTIMSSPDKNMARDYTIAGELATWPSKII